MKEGVSLYGFLLKHKVLLDVVRRIRRSGKRNTFLVFPPCHRDAIVADDGKREDGLKRMENSLAFRNDFALRNRGQHGLNAAAALLHHPETAKHLTKPLLLFSHIHKDTPFRRAASFPRRRRKLYSSFDKTHRKRVQAVKPGCFCC